MGVLSELQARSKRIVLIAAVARNRVIGDDDRIPWHLPEDFAHFKSSTLGQTLLMGRATFESIGRPLPGRTTIVLTRDPDWSHPGVSVAHHLQEAIDTAEENGTPGDLIVAGGSHLYSAMLPLAHLQIISEVDQDAKGNVFYPDWDRSGWVRGPVDPHDGFQVVQWIRAKQHQPTCDYNFLVRAVQHWWDSDCSLRLTQALEAERTNTSASSGVNWSGVYETAMTVIAEAAEAATRTDPRPRRWHRVTERRRVRLQQKLTETDQAAVQGTLFRWESLIAESCCRTT